MGADTTMTVQQICAEHGNTRPTPTFGSFELSCIDPHSYRQQGLIPVWFVGGGVRIRRRTGVIPAGSQPVPGEQLLHLCENFGEPPIWSTDCLQ